MGFYRNFMQTLVLGGALVLAVGCQANNGAPPSDANDTASDTEEIATVATVDSPANGASTDSSTPNAASADSAGSNGTAASAGSAGTADTTGTTGPKTPQTAPVGDAAPDADRVDPAKEMAGIADAIDELDDVGESDENAERAEDTLPAEPTVAPPALTPEEQAKQDAMFAEAEKDPEAWLSKSMEDDDFMSKELVPGKLLVDNEAALTRLDPARPIWVDKQNKRVIIQGFVCQTRTSLEFFICFGKGFWRTFPYRDDKGQPERVLQFNGPKAHESVLCTDVPASMIHAALLAIGANTGSPVKFQPQFTPPTGDEIHLTVRWTKEDGTMAEMPAQNWVVDMNSKEPMKAKWVFAGSFFYKDEDGNQRYAADSEGEIVGVSNFPSVMLDVNEASSNSDAERVYQANEKEVPPRGTPVTVIFSLK